MTPVLIAGGGPAGAATALTLARRGVACRVVEARPAVRRKVGETLPPNAAPLLERLGIREALEEPRHLACHGNRYLWGSDEVDEKVFLLHTHGHGWHLDRLVFEEQLAREAERRSVEWWPGCRLVAAVPGRRDGWRVTVDRGGERLTLESRFVVDATGRASRLASSLGTDRIHYDRLLGLASILRTDRDPLQYTHVEATEDGWWYAAPIPGRRLMTAFLTDADLGGRERLDAAAYLRALTSTRLIAPLAPPDPDVEGEVVARTAASSRLERATGEGWLAVGDAAYAYDPVSSYGLTSALGGGFLAGNAIADHLDGRPEALPAYASVLEKGYRLYLEMLRNQYRMEGRWPRSPFWRRRHEARFVRRT